MEYVESIFDVVIRISQLRGLFGECWVATLSIQGVHCRLHVIVDTQDARW